VNEIQDVLVIVAKVFIYLGATMFCICFVFGAYAVWQIWNTTLATIKIAAKWNGYHKLSPEGKLDFLKDTKLNKKED
jgi:hypothetical protein